MGAEPWERVITVALLYPFKEPLGPSVKEDVAFAKNNFVIPVFREKCVN
jgi:hypothetical protein